jgi:Superinfection immunity protein
MLADSAASAGSAAVGLILIIIGVAAYWTPTIVAWIRHIPNAGSVTVINFLLGWTLAGWVVALAMACRSHYPQPAVTQQVNVSLPRPPGDSP